MAVPAARLILVLALLPGAPWGATAGRPACPRPCSCPQPVELHCTFRSLVAFPPGISNQVERINLGFNSIHKMTDRSLSGLKKLELLMVHGNALHSLPDGVFRDLTSLQMLKMSYNKLSQISRRTLQGLWSLARLHLDHNRLEFIQPDTFQGLTSLRVLQLEGNRLRQLHPATLTTFSLLSHFHVSTLRHLYLADNGLTSLHPGLLKAAPLLENLQLHGNPWSCDCHMSWLRDWDKSSPGVLKCKKDKDYPGGELCPMCSFPRHLQGKEVQALDDMVCSGPVITSPLRATKPEDAESEVMTLDKFSEPLGNITLGLSDEHGNKVDLECGVGKPRELQRVNWEQVSPHRLAANITWSVDLDCPIDRENYERLWRLIAYYSDVPAHLEREIMLSKEPQRSYRYRQDMERDAQYYTGVKVIVMAQPRWLMQASLGLRLNRPQSTGKRVKLVLSSQLSQSVETELERRRGRTWVMIESTNTTQAVMAAVVGSTSRMQCSVRSSGEIVLHWVMPDGSQLEVPHNGPNDRVSASSDGQLVIKSIDHSDMGIYYCVAKVHGDLDILPFRLVVEESSSPRPGDDRPQPLPIQYYTGESIALPCEASGSPNAEINWILPRRNIVSTRANTSRALVYSNGTLQVLQGQLSDSGYYKCIAINQHGMDTYATKVNVTKRATQTTMRTPRKFPKMPQSASGVRTKITVPTEESVDGSGDEQVMKDVNTKTKLDPVRRRGPISGRRVISHPSRNTWRRPPVPRKPAQPRVDARKTLVDARRRVNVASNKIDPRKWADILAKVRDRKVQNSVTPNTVQQTPESKRTDATADPTIRLQNNMEGSGEGGAMQEEEEAIHTTTPTPMRILSTTNYVSSTSASKHTTRVTFNMRTNTINQQQQQQPTSAPQSSLTRWQTSTNRAGIRGSVSHDESSQGNQDTATDVPVVTTHNASHSQREGERKVLTQSGDFSAEKDRQVSVDVGRLSGPVAPTAPLSVKYLSQASTAPPEESTTAYTFPAQTQLRTASPTNRPQSPPFTAVNEESRREGPPRHRQPNSKRKNGGRRKSKVNRRRQRLNGAPQLITSTLIPGVDALLAGASTTASIPLKIEKAAFTTLSFPAAVPFTGSQVTSLGTLSHKESTVSRLDDNRPDLKSTSSPATEDDRLSRAKPPPKATTNDGAVSRESVPEVSEGESAFPPDRSDSDRPPSPEAALQTFPSSTLPPITPSVETQRGSVPGDQQPALHFDKSPGSAHTLPQVEADVPQQNQSGHRHTHSQVAENELFVKIHRPAPLLPPPSAHAPTVQHEAVTSSGDHEPSGLPEDKLDDNHCRFNAVSSRYNIVKRPHLPHSPIGCHANHCFVNDEQLPENGPSGPNPVSPAPKLSDSAHPVKRTTTQTPRVIPSTAAATATAAVQTSGASSTSREGRPTRPLPAPTQDASRVRPRPVPLSPPRGNPWIMRTYTQTVTVNTETDAHLPCEAVGQPHPFLSWTKVSTGASIAQNMKVNRFEVHSNGTLVIRSAQPTDRGQYLCRVQSQHGEDQVTLNLVVLLQHPRVLQPRHRDVTVHQGTSVHLDCTVQGHPPPRITWVLPDQVRVVTASMPTVTSDRRLALLSNGTLRISRAGHGDRGVYRCLGSSVAGTDAVTVQLHVSAAVPPAIEQAARENTSLAEGASAFLHCTTTGAPPPTVHWTTPDGTQLPAAAAATQLGVGRNLQVFPNGTLQVRGATAGNAGWYECTASNAMAASRRTVFLSVHRAKPSPAKARISVSSPLTTDVVYGGALRLDCQATGDPEPRSVTEEDAGDFLCLARNRAGDDFARLRVDVLTRPAKIHRKRLRSSHQEEEEEVEEEVAAYAGHLRVDCVASGLPDPAITWALPDGTMLNADSKLRPGRNRRYVVFGNGTLLFNDVGMPEEGDYTCYAENQLGKDEMKVRVKVKVVARPPRFRDGGHHRVVGVSYGETASLHCSADGEPAPVLSWISPTHRAIAPVPGKYGVLDNGTLVVHRVQRSDGGNYTCVARNAAGQSRKATALEVLLTAPSINGLQGVAAVSAVAVQGRTALVDCVAVGTPPPRVMWVLPGMAIVPVLYHSSRTTVHRNGTLELRAARRSDAGQLTCIARNEAGEARLAVNLSVQGGGGEDPQVGAVPGQRAAVDAPWVAATAPCGGSLRPTSPWVLPGGVPLPSGARLPPKFSHRHDGSWSFSDPSAAEAGAYRCPRPPRRRSGGADRHRVTPNRGADRRSPPDRPLPVAPLPTRRWRQQRCRAAPADLDAAQYGVVLTRPQHAGRYAVLPNGTLAIRQASVYDRGSYVCRVANALRRRPASAVQVEVVGRRQWRLRPASPVGPPSVTLRPRRGVAPAELNCAWRVGSGGGSAGGGAAGGRRRTGARLAVGTQPASTATSTSTRRGRWSSQNPTARDAGPVPLQRPGNAVGMDSKATYLNVF
ncbi:LOW QUALITY PROTEIN: hypothetical protein CRUP_037102 [Coryphaenoides rupestris]|nr:LOW QUALITY PROTEIN: hypothetical protein CRUP_037102 [Coryphaenoides rupestris]